MDSLRTPFFIVALVLLVLVVLIEISSVAFISSGSSSAAGPYANLKSPGLGISYLALVDGILLFSITLMALALVVPARIMGRVQGVINFIFFLLLLVGAIVLIIVAITLLVMMVTLLLAVPFGTIAYMAAFADFDVTGAHATLAALMTLKLVAAVFLVLAQPRFLEMKGLVLLIVIALVANIIVSFLHGLGPSFVVSILDALAAIIVGILGAIWALMGLIGSIPAIIKALRVDRAIA